VVDVFEGSAGRVGEQARRPGKIKPAVKRSTALEHSRSADGFKTGVWLSGKGTYFEWQSIARLQFPRRSANCSLSAPDDAADGPQAKYAPRDCTNRQSPPMEVHDVVCLESGRYRRSCRNASWWRNAPNLLHSRNIGGSQERMGSAKKEPDYFSFYSPILMVMVSRCPMPRLNAANLRRELAQRNVDRAGNFEHEMTYGPVPSVLYQDQDSLHGNFLPASYRSICAQPDWRRRLTKSYTASRRIVRPWERKRRELDCANSSDALLMNVFCYPRLLHRPEVCALLGIEPGLRPEFGFRALIPFSNGKTDRTEVDMKLGHLLVEAKLTEGGFQTASLRLLARYRDLDEVFHLGELPEAGAAVDSYQLIRGVLAAHARNCSFLVLCDGRRADLIEKWFRVQRTVKSWTLRSRLELLTWQELAAVLPKTLGMFLAAKYGID
jgi:hypothetical protein